VKNFTFPLHRGAGRRIVTAMSRLGSLVVAIVISASLGTAVVAAGPADAQTPGCVSHREVRQVQDHAFTKLRVHRIFETRGRIREADRQSQSRIYRGCEDGWHVWADYRWDGNAFRLWGIWDIAHM
jgi:hypothetical protein